MAANISISIGDGAATRSADAREGWVTRVGERWLHGVSFVAVIGLALALNAWSLSEAGYGNTYYAAAVRSMTMSWKAFFFGALDPGGFITVDKPPVFLWVDALSARVFGYSTWSILLPSSFAGAASVGLLWLIVRRYFGLAAATIAGFALALSPISVAVNRLNVPEPFMILALVGAAGAVLRSIESRRWWAWTALAGALVGVAFNTKMLAAWIPGPAFALALVAAAPEVSWASARRVLARLAVLGTVTLAVSASWMIVVDAWPASDRPFIGGSTNNTVLDLALGYNGFGRVDGADQGGPPGGGRLPPTRGITVPRSGVPRAPAQAPGGGPFAPGGQRVPGNAPGPGAPAAPAGRGAAGGFNGPGGIIAGIPGLLRMFDDANGGQIGWLLPFGLGGGLVALWLWRRDPTRRAFAVLFVGWIALYGGVFSYAHGIFHTYYTSAMAPGIAAMVGVGTVGLARAMRRDRRWLAAAIGLVAVTAWVQLAIAGRTPEFYGWVRPLMVVIAVAGVAAAVALTVRRLPATGALAASVAGLLLLPGAWSLSVAANPSLNATLPQAGPQQGASGRTFGSAAFDDGSAQLAAWLKARSNASSTWQLAVPSAQNGSRLIAEYGLSVMALGGFLGRDPAISVAGFAERVSSGDVRYVLVSEGGPAGRAPRFALPAPLGALRGVGGRALPGPGRVAVAGAAGPGAVLSAVEAACAPVNDTSLPAPYRGALYDCADRSDTIAQWAR